MQAFAKEALLAHLRKQFVKGSDRGFVAPNGSLASWTYDFRPALLNNETLDALCDALWEQLEPEYPFQVGGLETAAITLVTGLIMKAKQHGKQMTGFYVRKSRRKDGFQQQLEGNLTDEKIILVDDVLNSAKSFMRQIVALESEGKKVHAILPVVRYRDESFYTELKQRGIKILTLFTLDDFPESGGMQSFETKHPIPPPQNTFTIEWKFQSTHPDMLHVIPKSAPSIDNERLYFGADNGTLWALNQKDGTVAWKFQTLFGAAYKRIYSSSAVHDGLVYFGAYDGNVYALDATSGKKRWVYREADWVGSSPCIASDLGVLFVGLEFGLWKKQGGIAALDLKTGEKKWWSEVETYVHSSPYYSKEHGIVVVGSSRGAVYAYQAKNGKPLWQHVTNGAVRAGFAIDEKRGYVCFGSEDSHVYVLNIKTGALVHKIETLEPIYSTPTIADGMLYFGLLDKRIVAVDLKTGEIHWQRWTHSRVFATPIVVGGRVLCGSNDGRLYELDATTGKETGYMQLSERIVNKVAYNPETKQLFVPTHANEIYCLKRTG